MSHPNRVPFEGVLTLVDVVSDKAPSGARGHCVIVTRAAAKEALHTLRGMAVDYKAGWDGHDARRKVGVIERATLAAGSMIRVSGYLFGRDFPEVIETVQCGGPDEGELGMSFEMCDAHIEDMRDAVWTVTRFTFTGAAILLRERAAYKRTSFRLALADSGLRLAAAGVEMRSVVDKEKSAKER